MHGQAVRLSSPLGDQKSEEVCTVILRKVLYITRNAKFMIAADCCAILHIHYWTTGWWPELIQRSFYSSRELKKNCWLVGEKKKTRAIFPIFEELANEIQRGEALSTLSTLITLSPSSSLLRPAFLLILLIKISSRCVVGAASFSRHCLSMGGRIARWREEGRREGDRVYGGRAGGAHDRLRSLRSLNSESDYQKIALSRTITIRAHATPSHFGDN